jgi:hypothetical protein
LCLNKNNIYICSTPAPNNILHLNELTLDDQQKYLDMVEEFNLHLKEETQKQGYNFIDFYNMTVGKDKKSNGCYHLEDVHLKPKALLDWFQKDLEAR